MVWCITAGMRLIRQMPRRIMISMLFVMTGLSCVPSIGLENDWEGSPLGWKSSHLSVFEGIAFQRLSAVSGDSGTTEDERND